MCERAYLRRGACLTDRRRANGNRPPSCWAPETAATTTRVAPLVVAVAPMTTIIIMSRSIFPPASRPAACFPLLLCDAQRTAQHCLLSAIPPTLASTKQFASERPARVSTAAAAAAANVYVVAAAAAAALFRLSQSSSRAACCCRLCGANLHTRARSLRPTGESGRRHQQQHAPRIAGYLLGVWGQKDRQTGSLVPGAFFASMRTLVVVVMFV